MKKNGLLLVIFFLVLISGCAEKEISKTSKASTTTISTNSTETSTNDKKVINQISDQEYQKLLGTWECIDDTDEGSIVYLSKNDQ